MPPKPTRLGTHIRDLESRLPLAFDLFSGRRQPPCQRGEVIFFEDLTNDLGKIIMRVGNRTFVFTSSLVGTGVDHGGLSGLTDDDHCFSEDTELLTTEGWIPYTRIKEKETVAASFNLETGRLEWSLVVGKYVYDSFKELIQFKSRGSEILVTPEHKMVFRTADPERKPGWKWQTAPASKVERLSKAATFPMAANGHDEEFPRPDWYLKLLAWVVTEGHWYDISTSGWGAGISQSAGPLSDRIKGILVEGNVPHSVRVANNIGRLFARTKYATTKLSNTFRLKSDWCRNTIRCDLDENKTPKRYLLNLSERQFRVMLGEMVLGDGSVRGNGACSDNKHEKIDHWVETGELDFTATLASKNTAFVDWLQELCVRNGMRTCATQRDDGVWLVHLSKFPTQGSWTAARVPYEGKVWCVSVIKNKTLVLRRKGRPFIAGNTQYLLASGTRALTGNWNAGNFAITLGSIVGASGDLSIAPASGGGLSLTSSKTGGASSGFDYTDSVARTSGSLYRVINSAGDIRHSIGGDSASNAFLFGIASSATASHSAIWNLSGTVSRSLSYSNILDAALSQAGTGKVGNRIITRCSFATGGGAATLEVGGLDLLPTYLSTSTFGIHATANPIYGQNIVLTYAAGSSGTNINAWNLLLGNTGTAAGNINRWGGLLIAGRPTSIVATNAVGIHSPETVNVTAGTKITFDGTATVTASATQGNNDFTAYTEGDTYLSYSSGNTQLDVFVDNAQAFHFDAGGAAGTSRCYGLFTSSGAITCTSGNITTSSGDLVSSANVEVASGSKLKLDGSTGNTYLQFAASILGFGLGGANEMTLATSGLDLASGDAYTINGTRLSIAEATFTHNPSSAATYTMDLNDSILITDDSSGTARVLLDVYRNNNSGTRTVFEVRDSGPVSYFKVVSSTGVYVGSASTVPVGLWGATPIAQPSSTGEATGYTGGGGTALTHTDTFTGNSGTKAYTLNDIVKHLKAAGILATS